MSSLYPRIACCIPFCRCGTTKWPPGQEVICAKHWRLVSRSTKRRKLAIKRELDRLPDPQPDAQGRFLTADLRRYDRAHRMARMVWARCRAEVLRASSGL